MSQKPKLNHLTIADKVHVIQLVESNPAEYPNVEVCLFKWFTQCRDKNIPISRPLLKEKAEYFATQFGYSNFNASQGWLGNWKNRHNIIFRKICGESASVNDSLCNEWLGKLSNIIKEYSPDDVFNVDETALFFK
ncbi:tigger transposable element-derived protein 6-like [Daktulosphaira vitifoliae]|uniref:tigger transposable element-derived protein 6-like n=1 Tax=Daktulosphaira vitifoliae TaxID=58002 RepID=UPI0021AAA91E|nr:tigger transposable element-derived protein 6-like [Daktulosphaira vitifoliae]